LRTQVFYLLLLQMPLIEVECHSP